MIKRFLPHPKKRSANLGVLIPLIIVVIVVAFGVHISQWISPPSDPSLLTQSEDMKRYLSTDDLPNPLPTPSKLFESTLHIIGEYPSGAPELPPGSIAMVYIRDGWRFVEISYLPDTNVEVVRSSFNQFPSEDIMLSETIQGELIWIQTFSGCQPARLQTGIGTCRFSQILLFDLDDFVIRLAIDGSHATEGELIEMARSMIPAIDEAGIQ